MDELLYCYEKYGYLQLDQLVDDKLIELTKDEKGKIVPFSIH